MTDVRVIYGTERSSRSARIDRFVLDNWGHALLLVPTRQYATRRTERLITEGNLAGSWGRPVLTLDDFAVQLLRDAGRDPVLVRDAERRFLLDHSLERLKRDGKLDAVGAAAETQGFRSHVLRVITQLKQAAVEPHTFRECVRKRRLHSPLDDVVAEAYSAYQDALLEARVYDLPGLFWEAEFRCRDERPRAFEHVDLLALDGFDDFTPSEFRLISSYARQVSTLVFGLNYASSGNRTDLYKTTARTLEQIRRSFDARTAEAEEALPRTFLEFASSNLFWRDEPRLPSGLEANIEVMPCADFTQEIETIGRRVKSLLIDENVSAGEIAVVYRNLREAAATLRSVFHEFGIPLRMTQQPSLWESATFAFLMEVLDATETWMREPVVNVLSSPWFNPAELRDDAVWPHARSAFPLIGRLAQVISGVEEWRARLGRLLEYKDEETLHALRRGLADPDAAIAALLRGVGLLESIGRSLPEKASPGAFVAAVDAIVDHLGLPGAVESHALETTREYEREALRAFRELLGAWRFWDSADSSPLSRGEFLSALRQAARETAFAPPRSKGGVTCLDAESTRLLRYDHVFFGGANEGDVPRPAAASAIYSEEDLASLAEQGIVIEGRRAHAEREALLFHHVLNVPRKRLVVTWHMLSRQGGERYPSPYVVDVINLFRIESIQGPLPKAHEFVPAPGAAASWRDLRNAICVSGAPPEDLFPTELVGIRAGIGIERTRHDSSPFGVYDGILRASRIAAKIASDFAEGHVFSVAQIESYRSCPFRFFLERVLKIAETDTPVAEFDAMIRGSILHSALQAFHEQYRGLAVADIDAAEALESMRIHLDTAFTKHAWRSTTAPRGVEAVERARILAALERYLRIERDRDEAHWKPLHVELGFGRTPGDKHDALTRSEPYALDTPEGKVLFAGRIDRVDRAGSDARIIDYKSGGVPQPKEIAAGVSLQLAIYALALEEYIMDGAQCREAWFLQVGRDKRTEALGRTKKTDEWPERQQLVRDAVAECVASMRSGLFPPTPTDSACAFCGANRVCRYEQSRIERKGSAL